MHRKPRTPKPAPHTTRPTPYNPRRWTAAHRCHRWSQRVAERTASHPPPPFTLHLLQHQPLHRKPHPQTPNPAFLPQTPHHPHTMHPQPLHTLKLAPVASTFTPNPLYPDRRVKAVGILHPSPYVPCLTPYSPAPLHPTPEQMDDGSQV